MTEPTATLLESSRSSEQQHKLGNRAQRFRFRHCQMERLIYRRVLAKAEPDEKRRKKGEACGSWSKLFRHHKTGELAARGNYCESRTCPACAVARRQTQAARLAEWIRLYGGKRPRMVTLTMRSTNEPLVVQLDALIACFKQLRRVKLWQNCVDFGKAIIEITYNSATCQWHPHLHVIVVGRYLPRDPIIEHWKRITGGSWDVDIRKLWGRPNMAGYLTSYLGKPPLLPDETDAEDLAVEFYEGLRNRKMILNFGGGPPLPDDPTEGEDPADSEDWQYIGELSDILKRAEEGDEEAVKIRSLLAAQFLAEKRAAPD